MPAELIENLPQALQILATRSFSGPLPPADELNKYSSDHQERIFRIAEAFTVDESKRRDRVTSSVTRTAAINVWVTPALYVFTVLAAVGLIVWQPNWIGVWGAAALMSVPVLRSIGAFFSRFRRARREVAEPEES